MELGEIIGKLRSKRDKLDQAISALESMGTKLGRPPGAGSGKRKMSAAGRAAIIAAQKKRWAAHNAAKK